MAIVILKRIKRKTFSLGVIELLRSSRRLYLHCIILCSAINGKLYAVGGRNAAGELSTVECYSPKTNEWCFVEKMLEPHYGHAGM